MYAGRLRVVVMVVVEGEQHRRVVGVLVVKERREKVGLREERERRVVIGVFGMRGIWGIIVGFLVV